MQERKKKLEKIKTSALSRGMSLTKLAVKSGVRLASAQVQKAFDKEKVMDQVFKSNALSVVQELGKLKGSAMKMGQSLAIIGEHFFPKEISAILKTLNEDSEDVAWDVMRKSLVKTLGEEKLSRLKIDEDAFAAASLGQVHRATIIETGEDVCLKIQYPGVAQSIDSDLKTLKSILKVSKFLPAYGDKFDMIFAEIKTMLKKEVDYVREAKSMEDFRTLLSGDSRYLIPKVYEDFSSKTVLTTSFQPGDNIDSPVVAALPMERRKKLAENCAELFLRELFEFFKIQTDPHFGNYKVQSVGGQDQLVLLDFGAVRKYAKSFMKAYADMVLGALARDEHLVLKGAQSLNFIREDDSEDLRKPFVEYCYMVVEPWATPDTPGVDLTYFNDEGLYQWHLTDLPNRLRKDGAKLALLFKFRPPPKEIVFLDRKLAGMFTTLKILEAPFDANDVILRVLKSS